MRSSLSHSGAASQEIFLHTAFTVPHPPWSPPHRTPTVNAITIAAKSLRRPFVGSLPNATPPSNTHGQTLHQLGLEGGLCQCGGCSLGAPAANFQPVKLHHHHHTSNPSAFRVSRLSSSLPSNIHPAQQMAFVLSSASRRAFGAARVGSVLQRTSHASVMTTGTRSIGSDSRVVCITSGKGGVGKTTTAASIGMGLALKGKKTCVIDFDIGLRNLDIHLVRV